MEKNQEGLLEVFQDLTLRSATVGRSALRKALVDLAVPPWRHAEAEEDRLRRHALSKGDILAFERDTGGGLEAASLVLWQDGQDYKVLNIVPLKVGELGYTKYNALLDDFIKHIVAPAAEAVGFEFHTTRAKQSLDDWLSPGSASALRQFSSAANKSTGSGHPLDRKRWFAFLLAVHKGQESLSTDRLARWLCDIEGWSYDKAHELVIEYEFGLALLEEYERNQ